jgi:hypothetical protein
VLVAQPTEVAQSDGNCFVGVGFKEGHVGLISQVKWFLSNINDKAVYVDTTKL